MEVAGAQARVVPLLLRHPSSLRTSVSVSVRRSWAAAATAEGYDKVPMDTPGAYRLVDRATGRSVIVWGGTDDGDEAAMPSPAVLSRIETTDRPSRGHAPFDSAAHASSQLSAPIEHLELNTLFLHSNCRYCTEFSASANAASCHSFHLCPS